MSAPKFNLAGLTAILDYNGGQIDGPVREVMNLEPILDKWKAFNWVVEEVDGHNIGEILKSLAHVRKVGAEKGKPQILVAKTVKGKGVSFMEGKIEWHGVAPTKDQLDTALKELK